MGITIHYSGSVKTFAEIKNIIAFSKEYSENLNWKYAEIDKDGLFGIMMLPHEKCEAVKLVVDQELKLSAFTKTVYAPIETHKDIVILLYNLKKYFKKFKVIDESGIWDEYVESFKKPSKALSLVLNELSENQRLEYENGFIDQCQDSTVEKWFWSEDESYGYVNFSIIRDLMRKDLSLNKHTLISLNEVLSFTNDEFIKQRVIEGCQEWAIILLAEVWLNKCTNSKLNDLDCKGFAWIISYACFGFDGGYLNNFHRNTEKLFKKLVEETGRTQDKKKTLQIFYSLLSYLHIERTKIEV